MNKPQELDLKSVGNARELGGYKTQDGRLVKRNLLLRTADITKVTDEDKNVLRRKYNLSTVVDFRSDYERDRFPIVNIDGVVVNHISILDSTVIPKTKVAKLDISYNEESKYKIILAAVDRGIVSEELYVNMVSSETGRAGYTEFVRLLVGQPKDEAILFHCTQGKDRTGIAALIVLSILGVDEQTIFDDYLLTNVYNKDIIEKEKKELKKILGEGADIEKYMSALDQVNIDYMKRLVEFMKEQCGSVVGYIKENFGATDEIIAELQEKYLEEE